MEKGTENNFVVTQVFGYVKPDSWLEWNEDLKAIVGMGAKTTYDDFGNITSIVVEPTGLVIYSEPPVPQRNLLQKIVDTLVKLF
jgi:hypothetical protein